MCKQGKGSVEQRVAKRRKERKNRRSSSLSRRRVGLDESVSVDSDLKGKGEQKKSVSSSSEEKEKEKAIKTHSIETGVISPVVASDPDDDDSRRHLKLLDGLGNGEGLSMVRRVDIVGERAEEDVVGRGREGSDGFVEF